MAGTEETARQVLESELIALRAVIDDMERCHKRMQTAERKCKTGAGVRLLLRATRADLRNAQKETAWTCATIRDGLAQLERDAQRPTP